MGFIRGSGFVIVSVLLFVSIFCMGFFYMIFLSLEYDTLQSKLVSNSDNLVREIGVYDNFVQNFPVIQSACDERGFYNLNMDYGSLDINCDDLSEDADEAYYQTLGDFVMQGYYNEYDCSVIQCWEETKSPNFLFSEKTRDYASSKLYFFILIGLVLAGLMFVLIEKRSTLPIVVGAMFSIVSLIFMKLDATLAFISDKMVLSFVAIFLTSTYSVFVRFVSLGIGLIILGIVLKLFLVGFKIKGIVNWFKEKTRKGKIKKLENRISKTKKVLSKKDSKKEKISKKNKKGSVSIDASEEE